MSICIIIPARYGSTRFPGKPLAELGGRTMLERVYAKAKDAVAGDPDIRIAVATDDERIAAHCRDKSMPVVMTPEDCATGSDRVIEAADKMGLISDDVVINLQGDAPLMPVAAIRAMLDEFWTHPATKVATPVKRLRWAELDALREAKKTTPFSGTTVAVNTQSRALWFSKNVIPAIRKEKALRETGEFSPVYQHLGLYGYQVAMLERFTNLKPGTYEELEGLEQLRFIENGIPVQCVEITPGLLIHAGIDSPEDLERAKKIIEQEESV
ncbi:MAG: 3-deoxy-manno-octulosonate cytidylyltransferase [Rhodospirillales bacterium]|nr:3-deoxy-manno-octulosonate cytidylyltransferase [Alphaproteobacteria bacterium]MCB9987092.1 3-deoxy-manno-octulosonate cytidylyltransferase [Rhodospirillales bacterium]USO08147.1 MAG: 3-deoxy-manno-octulosonate cytidylyltransferase [Rhodospirillales bacterium]